MYGGLGFMNMERYEHYFSRAFFALGTKGDVFYPRILSFNDDRWGLKTMGGNIGIILEFIFLNSVICYPRGPESLESNSRILQRGCWKQSIV